MVDRVDRPSGACVSPRVSEGVAGMFGMCMRGAHGDLSFQQRIRACNLRSAYVNGCT